MSVDVADQSVTELSSGAHPNTLPRMVVINKLPPLEVLRAGLTLIGVGVFCYLLWRVQDVLFLLTLAILLATAIEPLVYRLRRGPFTRGSGVLVVYTLIVIVIGVPAYIVVPNLISQAASFPETLPDRLERLRPYAENLQPKPVQGFAVGLIDNGIQAVKTPAAPLRPTSSR